MKNRAKCKLCNDVIESFHPTDLVFCSCGQIGLDGGDSLKCMATDWRNFVRVDDDGNEVVVQVKERVEVTLTKEDIERLEGTSGPTKSELLDILSEMIKTYEALPQVAMTQPITHYDLLSILMLVSSIFRSDADC